MENTPYTHIERDTNPLETLVKTWDERILEARRDSLKADFRLEARLKTKIATLVYCRAELINAIAEAEKHKSKEQASSDLCFSI